MRTRSGWACRNPRDQAHSPMTQHCGLVAVIGAPNAGKSTLLNALLNEEKAIVSDIAGTTRDFIEDELSLGGVIFRFIDTAGIRQTTDEVESIGIQKTFEKIEQAQVVLFLIDSLQLIIENENKFKIELEIHNLKSI